MIKNFYFILDEHGNAVPAKDTDEFVVFFESADRIVARTTVSGYEVSTVFLGMNHPCIGIDKPILWETMIFSDSSDESPFEYYQERYTSRADALKGHTRAVQFVLSSPTKGDCSGSELMAIVNLIDDMVCGLKFDEGDAENY